MSVGCGESDEETAYLGGTQSPGGLRLSHFDALTPVALGVLDAGRVGFDLFLQKAADLVREKAGKGNTRIEGHTDAKGSDSYNHNLSNRRAESVKRWFTSHGLEDGNSPPRGSARRNR